MKICLACKNDFQADDFCCPVCSYSPELQDGHLVLAPGNFNRIEGFRANYFDSLAKLENGSFWFESRNRLLIWALNKYFPNFKSFFEISKS